MSRKKLKFKVAVIRDSSIEYGVVNLAHLLDCNKRYERTLRQYNNIGKEDKKIKVQNPQNEKVLAMRNALRDRIIKATIKDINKEAY